MYIGIPASTSQFHLEWPDSITFHLYFVFVLVICLFCGLEIIRVSNDIATVTLSPFSLFFSAYQFVHWITWIASTAPISFSFCAVWRCYIHKSYLNDCNCILHLLSLSSTCIQMDLSAYRLESLLIKCV